jgi:hypothetical protein
LIVKQAGGKKPGTESSNRREPNQNGKPLDRVSAGNFWSSMTQRHQTSGRGPEVEAIN